MVRLKEYEVCKRITKVIKFQFLMVRLKVIISIPPLNYITRFQFLMVRLKVRFFWALFDFDKISIPYGAIKSIIQFYS